MKPILGPIVGAVTRNSSKIWMFWDPRKVTESVPQCHAFRDESCTKQIFTSPFHTISDSVHECGAIHGVAGLADISFPAGMEKVYFKIKSTSANDEEDNVVYSIRPFPDSSTEVDTLTFSLISCHRPTFDYRKDIKTVAAPWQHLGNKMREHDCRFLIQAGDQVYSDHKKFNAWKWSLKEDSREKRLWYYRQIYLKSWHFREVQEVMSAFPQYMIWDDHEITNGWGSEKKHSERKYQRIFEIARQAYIEFQHCHNPDPLRKGAFYYTFNYGPAAFLCMDLRGHRAISRYDPRSREGKYPLAGEEQWNDIKALFNSVTVRESQILFVITSVPVCHLCRKYVSLGIFKNDICDQWSTRHNKNERRILLDLLYSWSGEKKKPVVILGGDVHVGTIAKITKKETGKIIHQVTSSPITNKPAFFLDFFMAKCSSTFNFHLDKHHTRPVYGKIIRRYRKRNFAIMKIQFTKQHPKVNVYMYEEGKEKPEVLSLC